MDGVGVLRGEHGPEPGRERLDQIIGQAGQAVGLEAAAQLGVRTEDDVFGGVVPTAFAATKTITHPLVHPQARAPAGWSHDFADRVSEAVLHGYTAFSRDDAHRAAARLLDHGPTRIKLARGIGGHGQFVIQASSEAR